MEIEKIGKLGHFDEKGRRSALFCFDYCKGFDRMALGGIDGSISFWKELGQNPVKTATLTRHDGAVLAVKWAPKASLKRLDSINDPILASGSDDSIILIWKFERYPLCNNLGKNRLVEISRESKI
jgi:WD40 repeat protein